MLWIIVPALVVIAVVVIVLFKKRAAMRAAEEIEQDRRKQEEIRRKLKPGARFEAFGSFGNTIEGTVVKVTDRNTIEAHCRAHNGQGGERGRFPISNIYWVSD